MGGVPQRADGHWRNSPRAFRKSRSDGEEGKGLKNVPLPILNPFYGSDQVNVRRLDIGSPFSLSPASG